MNRNQYLYHDDHEAIISRDDFIAVQHLIANAKYGHRGLLPHLHVVETGALKGFVAINTKWASFKEQDYYDAVCTIDRPDESENEKNEMKASPGDFDLRGFEVTRSQFITTQNEMSATFSDSTILFSKMCISKLDNVSRIELLFDPIQQILAVRPSTSENRHSVLWAKPSDTQTIPRQISGTAFLPTFFKILNWKEENKYRIRGIRRQKGNETVLLFNLKDTEIIIPMTEDKNMFDEHTMPVSSNSHSTVIAYPVSWVDSFGMEVYAHGFSPELVAIDCQGKWDLQVQGTPVSRQDNLAITSRSEIKNGIDTLIRSMKEEVAANG